MEVMERAPDHIAQQEKFLRKTFRLTQENLANAAGLTTRTIEKIESGRHRPEEQTVRSLARAFNIDVKYFEKPSPQEEAQQKAEIVRSIRKIVMVPTDPIRTVQDLLNAFEQRHAFRFDTSQVQEDGAMETAASMVDWIKDLNDAWDDCSMSDRLHYARNFVDLCKELEGHGYLCHMGTHKQLLREQGRSDLVFVVGLMSLQPKGEVDGRRYALVHLEGRWETAMEDRIRLPEDFLKS